MAGPAAGGAVAAPGDLDRSFSGDGVQALAVGHAADERVAGVAIQPDGKVVVGVSTGATLAVARHRVDGTLDPSFGGGDGFAASSVRGRALGVGLASDGSIVVAGTAYQAARFSADGVPEASYSAAGDVPAELSREPRAADVRPDGSVVIAGARPGSADAVVVRRAPDGSLDRRFSGDGIAVLALGGHLVDAAFAPDGGIVAGVHTGDWSGRLVAARLGPGGELDLSFGTGGVARSSALGGGMTTSVDVQSDGSVVVAGIANGSIAPQFGVARFTPDGQLDPGFSGDGQLTTRVWTQGSPVDLAVLGDGRIVVGGSTFDGDGHGVVLTRYQSDGGLDLSFGDGGKVVGPLKGFVYPEAIAVGDDGSVAAVGFAQDPRLHWNGGRVAVVRYGPQGALDPRFSGDGRSLMVLGPSEPAGRGRAVVVQPDGKVLVAGTAHNDATGADFAVTRLLVDGTADPAFGGGDGTVETDFAGHADVGLGVALQPDGRVVVVGSTMLPGSRERDSAFALARYTADGRLDASFSGDGLQTTNIVSPDLIPSEDATDVIVQPDGRIVLAGTALLPVGGQRGAVIVRYTAAGDLDPGFSGDGRLELPAVSAFDDADAWIALASAPDGKLVVGGAAPWAVSSTPAMAVARLHADGALDEGLAGTGVVRVSFPGASSRGQDVAVQGDGRIIVAGAVASANSALDAYDFALARLTPDGALDPGFGDGGRVRTDVSGGYDAISGVAVAPDGSIVAGGTSRVLSFSVARYGPSGALDPGFGSGGVTITTPDDPLLGAATGLALDGDRRAVVVGDAPGSQRFWDHRYSAEQLLDTLAEPQTPRVAAYELGGSGAATGAASAPLSAPGKGLRSGRLKVKVLGRGRLGRRFSLRVKCSVACAATVRPRLTWKRKGIRLRPARRRLRADRPTTIRIAVPARARRAMHRRLRRGRVVRARVEVLARSRAATAARSSRPPARGAKPQDDRVAEAHRRIRVLSRQRRPSSNR